MRIPVVTCVLVLTAAAPAWAQQSVEIQVPETTKQQVAAFERSLRGAIDAAAEQLNRRVRQALPNRPTTLAFLQETIVNGVWMPDGGAVFNVLIPGIQEVDYRILTMELQRGLVAPGAGLARAGNPGRVGATGVVVEPDPPAASTPVVPPLTNPDAEYTQFTREALVDAMLDGALALPIPEGKHLTVLANELPAGPQSPFTQRSRTLILQISGEDLLALRQNRITRDEAKARIKESKY